MFNYMIKYEVFRNDKFIINVVDIINDNNLSAILKAKIKDRTDLGKDERYGRRMSWRSCLWSIWGIIMI